MRQIIDHYAILGEKTYKDGYFFIDGYKTLPTMKKKYKTMLEELKGKPHNKLMLVARNYDREIIKIYFQESEN